MMKWISRVFVVVFVLLLCLPKLQRVFHIFPRVYLGGSEAEPYQPPLAWGTWLDGSFQAACEQRYIWRFSFRGYLVRTWNQLQYSLFDRQPARGGTEVVIGRNRWLYEKNYIRDYNRPAKTPLPELRARVARLRRFQDLLQTNGIACLLVIAPSKVEIYPEYVPPGWLAPDRAARRTDYDNLVPLLNELGIHYIDAHRDFLERKQAGAPLLFAAAGTHWNYYGAGLVVSQILARLERLTGKDFPDLSITGVEVDTRPHGTDNDLEKVLNLWGSGNLWDTLTTVAPQVHPRFRVTPGADRPDILFLGDSFVHTLTEVMDELDLYRRRDTLYYFNRRYRYPVPNPEGIERFAYLEQNTEPINRHQMDFRKELAGRDAVVIEVTEFWLPQIGFGFPEFVLNAAEKASAAPSPHDPALNNE